MATERTSLAIAFASLLCFSAPARADWAHLVQACSDAAKQNGSGAPATAASTGLSIKDLNTQGAALISKWDKRYPWEDCILKLSGLEVIAPVFGSLGPGAGTALGARSEHAINSGRVQSLLTARGLVSFNGSYVAEVHHDVMMPSIGQWHAATATFEDQIIISPFIRRSDLHAMPFYGVGPESSAAARTEYREQRTEAGVIGSVPLASWFAAGGGITYLAPAIDQVSQPHFLDSQAFVRLHTPTRTAQTAHRHEVRLTYDAYSDRGSGANSFQRLQLFALGSYELRRPLSDPFADRSWFQNFLCQPIVGDECRAGNLVVDALVTTASARPGQSIPFYLQDTLGGTDREGLDTLRGLDDLRLRAPNRALLQAEFYKDVNGWFGVFAFVDAGTVAVDAADLTSGRWHHDYGPGIFVRAGGHIVVRAFVAFGGGEGIRSNFRFAGGL
jgi:hypothetical protein